MAKLRTGIAGGAGYTGGELIRLLINHPQAELAYVLSNSNAGNPVSAVHGDLAGETNLRFSSSINEDVDVLFLCVGHGEARKFLETNNIPDKVKVIDLSHDFRLSEKSQFHNRKFVYGLPELNKQLIQSADNIANPGCFATSIQLGLLPLAKEGLLSNIYTTGITGSTGAGQGLSQTSHFSWRANNIQAYKTLTHQHLAEIGESFGQLQNTGTIDLSFVPWRGDFTRGIFISSQIDCDLNQKQLTELYKDFYQDHPFTHVLDEPIFLKQVVNTNKCFIQLEKVGTKRLSN